MRTLQFSSLGNKPYALYILTSLNNVQLNLVSVKDKSLVHLREEGGKLTSNVHECRKISQTYYPKELEDEIELFVEFAIVMGTKSSLAEMDYSFQYLNHQLKYKSFLLGGQLTLADFVVFDVLKNYRQLVGYFARFGDRVPHLIRYLDQLNGQFREEIRIVDHCSKKNVSTLEYVYMETKAKYRIEIPLPGAKFGKVVTRFPPEASGYLHIGHGKALCINRFLADQWGGKMIFRFDNTNPVKERLEYEHGIKEDIKTLGISYEFETFTSDHFDTLLDYAEKLIQSGDAFVDDSPKEEFTERKRNQLPSLCRDRSIADNLALWEEMKKGSRKDCALRIKLQYDSLNGAMRDPVIYRVVDKPHDRTGDKFKVYPTYDFACPIVDSIEGVTHALRTSEYKDRDDQFYAILDKVGLRKPMLRDYSRLAFQKTVMSKRKLQALVDYGIVEGWDDPRFPTIRGLFRRGLSKEGFFQFVVGQATSTNVATLEWDALWSLNKKIIDPIVPRYTALRDPIPFTIADVTNRTKRVALHPKNSEVGTKEIHYESTVLLASEDVERLNVDEEITLRNWGNVIVTGIVKEAGKIISASGKLHLEGSPSTTTWKLTWLPSSQKNAEVDLISYDHLFFHDNLVVTNEEEIRKAVNVNSKHVMKYVADNDVVSMKKGDMLQFERIGYFILDDAEKMQFIRIPEPTIKKKK